MEKIRLDFNNKNWEVYLRDEVDRSVFLEIFKWQEYRIATEIIKKAQDPIIDVGAHIGFFSLYCRSFNLTVDIFAFEPEPRNFELLKQHIIENKVMGVQCIPAALAEKTGEHYLYISKDNHNHHLIPDTSTSSSNLKINSYSFADFCNSHNIKKVSLLKMDIEGGEYELFSGLTPDDFSSIGAIIMEYHNQGKNTYQVIEQALREQGFGVQIFPSRFDKTMGFLWAKNKRVAKGF